MSTAALMQLGRAEFARICDGKAPSIDSVLTLGQYVMGQLKVEGVPVSDLAERTVDIVGEILAVAVAAAAATDVSEELKSFAANYATEYAPVLRVAISGAEAVAAAVAADPGAAPRWKAILMAVLGTFQICMSTRAVSAVAPGAAPVAAVAAQSPQQAVLDVAQAAAADVIPSFEELVQDARLIVDAKAPLASHAPTPPPTPDQTHEASVE